MGMLSLDYFEKFFNIV